MNEPDMDNSNEPEYVADTDKSNEPKHVMDTDRHWQIKWTWTCNGHWQTEWTWIFNRHWQTKWTQASNRHCQTWTLADTYRLNEPDKNNPNEPEHVTDTDKSNEPEHVMDTDKLNNSTLTNLLNLNILMDTDKPNKPEHFTEHRQAECIWTFYWILTNRMNLNVSLDTDKTNEPEHFTGHWQTKWTQVSNRHCQSPAPVHPSISAGHGGGGGHRTGRASPRVKKIIWGYGKQTVQLHIKWFHLSSTWGRGRGAEQSQRQKGKRWGEERKEGRRQASEEAARAAQGLPQKQIKMKTRCWNHYYN